MSFLQQPNAGTGKHETLHMCHWAFVLLMQHFFFNLLGIRHMLTATLKVYHSTLMLQQVWKYNCAVKFKPCECLFLCFTVLSQPSPTSDCDQPILIPAQSDDQQIAAAAGDL